MPRNLETFVRDHFRSSSCSSEIVFRAPLPVDPVRQGWIQYRDTARVSAISRESRFRETDSLGYDLPRAKISRHRSASVPRHLPTASVRFARCCFSLSSCELVRRARPTSVSGRATVTLKLNTGVTRELAPVGAGDAISPTGTRSARAAFTSLAEKPRPRQFQNQKCRPFSAATFEPLPGFSGGKGGRTASGPT